MSELNVSLEASPKTDDVDWVQRRLREFNVASAGSANLQLLTLFLRDANGVLCGGLLGWSVWSWLHIDTLWVEEPHRCQGWGRSLLNAAETEARRRGCTVVDVDTFSFQARGFYEKAGYVCHGLLAGVADKRDRIFLSKRLV